MPGYFVRSALLNGSAELIRELGGRPHAIARAAGIPLTALQEPDVLLSGRPAYAFFELAAAECRCPSFGLQLGSRASMAAVIGPLWILLRNAATIGQMFEDLAQNFDIYTSVATMAVERVREGMIVSWSSTSGQAPSEVQMADFSIAVVVREIRSHVPGWMPQSVEFRHAAPETLAEHRRILGPNLGFDRDRNAIFIERRTLEHRLDTGTPGTRALVSALLRRDEDVIDPDIGVRVESIVRAMLPFVPCTIREVAKAMHLPVRTLQHRLDGSGRPFKAIKDAVRADLALKYLEHSNLGLSEIAEILGYSQLSAFSRSFRRWHGRPARSVRSARRQAA